MKKGYKVLSPGSAEYQSQIAGYGQNKKTVSKVVDMNTGPGDIYIRPEVAYNSRTDKSQDKGNSDRENNVKVEALLVPKNFFSYLAFHF